MDLSFDGRSTDAELAAVPLSDAPPVVTHIAWPAHSRSLALAALIRAATRP